MSKIKRKLTKISFDFDKAHLAYTSSDFPACSLLDDPILLKSLEEGKELTIEQMSILETVGHNISSASKSKEAEESNTPSSSGCVNGDDNLNINQEGNDNTMSEQLQKEMAELRKELALAKAETALASYELEAELKKSLAAQISQVEDMSVITKALDAMIAANEAAVTKAKEELATELEKAKAASVEENPLQKELSKDAGEGGDAPAPVEKSRSARIAEFLDNGEKQ